VRLLPVLLACALPGVVLWLCFFLTFRRDIEVFSKDWPKGMSSDEIARAVSDFVNKMTLREKIAQMSGDGGNTVLLKLGIYVLLLKRFPRIYSGYNRRFSIPPLSFTDGPRGVVIGHATCFPVAMARGASWDPDLEQRVGMAIGREARATGANYFAGLCVNLLRHPAWGRAQETYGEDSFHIGMMGLGLMRGVQSQHVMVCAKHFAVNSIENSRFYLDVMIDPLSLHEIYLPHFKRLVYAGVDSLMSAYNKLNGEY
jgi:beta-glucosidase